MLLTDLKEKREKRVVIEGTDANAFRAFLSYLYLNEMKLCECTEDVLLKTCALGHLYDVGPLVSAILSYMHHSLKVENVLPRLLMAELYDFVKVQSHCWSFIEAKTNAVIQDESFLDLPKVCKEV